MTVPAQRSSRAELHRATVNIDQTPSRRYLLPDTATYAPQYANIYFARLQQLRPHVQAAAKAFFGEPSSNLLYADTIVEATASSRQQSDKTPKRISLPPKSDDNVPSQEPNHPFVVITGVVFRHMQSKPSILAQYDHPSPHTLIPDPPPRSTTTYVSPSTDQIFLEDEHARCKLDLEHVTRSKVSMFKTGFIVAVRGRENHQSGTYTVHDVTFGNPAWQPPRPALSSTSPSSRAVCIVSGLGLSPNAVVPELLLESLRGTFSTSAVPSTTQVVHTIVAGNLLNAPPSSPSTHVSLSVEAKVRLATNLAYLDRFFLALATAIPVSLMPGHLDASNALLPQQPLHRCLIPNASRCKNLFRVPNPHALTLGGVHIVGTSGQNVLDLALYETDAEQTQDEAPSAERVLDLLESLVRGRHLAPTCPDTLGCYPFVDNDPFVLEETPHVLFAGNQKEFGTRKMSLSSNPTDGERLDGDTTTNSIPFVRLISVPCFALTGQAVFLDIVSLECTVQEFGVTYDGV